MTQHHPTTPALVGVVHLLPLPGSPRGNFTPEEIIKAAIRDARAYAQGGATGLIVENFGDAPFLADQVEPHTVAMMALAVRAVRESVAIPVGVNVLRNDAAAAVGIAAMAGAEFVRINVHTGVSVTDQGVITGRAAATLRYRRQLGSPIAIWADVHVKHGVPLGAQPIEDAAEDAVVRGLADAVIVSGRGTGYAAEASDVARLRAALPDTPIYVGSGVSSETASRFLPEASGFIVGTWAKADGKVNNPVDPRRVRQLAESLGLSPA